MEINIKKKKPDQSSDTIHTETNEQDNYMLNKLDILVINNGWNDSNEKIILDIGDNCDTYNKLHKKTYNDYKRKNNVINLSLLILSLFLTTDSILELIKSDVLVIIKKILISIVAVISIINNFFKYGELSQQHLHASNSFSMIYSDIRNIMCTYRKDRMNALKYIQDKLKEYDHLVISSPDIKQKLINSMVPNNKLDDLEVIIDKDNTYNKKDKDNRKNKDSKKTDQFNILLNKPTTTAKSNNLNNSNNKFKINNMQNLQQIHDCFKIDGELSEIDNITLADVQNYKKRGLDLQTQYEFNRFMKQ